MGYADKDKASPQVGMPLACKAPAYQIVRSELQLMAGVTSTSLRDQSFMSSELSSTSRKDDSRERPEGCQFLG